VHDGDQTVTVYVDGETDLTATRRYTTVDRGVSYISYPDPSQRVEGMLDEFMIFDKALSAAEVKALYARQK
jgi:hypothetical protein